MKRLILILALLALPCSAFADHWVRDGVFEPGYCVACAVTFDGRPFCVNAVALGTVEEAEEACQILNDEPMTMPGEEPVWIRWDSEKKDFVRTKFPCRYVKGTTM